MAGNPCFLDTDFADKSKKNYLSYHDKTCMMVIFCVSSISPEKDRSVTVSGLRKVQLFFRSSLVRKKSKLLGTEVSNP